MWFHVGLIFENLTKIAVKKHTSPVDWLFAAKKRSDTSLQLTIDSEKGLICWTVAPKTQF